MLYCSGVTFRSFLFSHLAESIRHFPWDPDEVVQGSADSMSKKTLKTPVKVRKVNTTVAVSTVLILFIILFVSKSQI